MKRILAVTLITIVLLSAAACGGKVNSDPWKNFNSISARADRVATIYAPAAIDALPLLAAELKWDADKTEKVKGWIVKIRDSAAAVHTTLGRILDSAITPDSKVLIGPLLTAIADGVDQLDGLNLFGSLESSSKVDLALRLTALGLRETGRLLTLPPEPKPQAKLEWSIWSNFEGGSFSYA